MAKETLECLLFTLCAVSNLSIFRFDLYAHRHSEQVADLSALPLITAMYFDMIVTMLDLVSAYVQIKSFGFFQYAIRPDRIIQPGMPPFLFLLSSHRNRFQILNSFM